MAERTSPAPDWLVERLVAGELPPQVAAELRARLKAHVEEGRVEQLCRSNDSILAAHPPASVAAEVTRRSLAAPLRAERQASLSRFALPTLALGGSALVLMLLLLPTSRLDTERALESGPAGALAPEQVTSKGLAPQLSVYKRTASGAERLREEDRVRAGDTLQMAYVAAGAAYGVVASVDGEGTVTLHLPEEAGSAARLAESGETALPHAFELDGAAGFERFVLVTSSTPFPTSLVVARLAGEGAWPRELLVTELALEKATR